MSGHIQAMKLIGLIASAFILIGSFSFARTPKNIVLIMADDIGIECFGSYGGTSYKTPHLDKLAATGLPVAGASVATQVGVAVGIAAAVTAIAVSTVVVLPANATIASLMENLTTCYR